MIRVLFLASTCLLLAGAAVAPQPPRPLETDATAIVERSRKTALEYGRSLPDFVCTEVIHRYTDANRRPGLPRIGNWLLKDTLTVKLSYFEQKEEHQLTLIEGKPANRTYESLGGALGAGEFGGMLHSIFDPSSAASFRWKSWINVRRRRAAAYSYAVQQPHSSYLLVSGVPGNLQPAIVGYHGELDIDRETGAVLSLTYEADNIPKELAWDSAITTVEYEFVNVGGRSYLLPASSETVMRGPILWMRNRMEFRNYGKFSSESNITFGDGK